MIAGREGKLVTELEPLALDVDLRGYWRIVQERRWVMLAVVALVLLATLLVTLTTSPTYRASASLQIERDTLRVINTEGLVPAESPLDRDFYQTQFELLRSRSLALQVIQDLDLARDPYFAGGNPAPPNGEALESAQRALIDRVLASLTVEPVSNSRLVRIHFDATEPGIAARVANQYAQAFIASNIERRFEASAYAKQYLEERLADLKERLEASERELVRFAEKEQIVSLGEDRPSLSAQNLGDLNALLATAQDERIRSEAQWRQAAAGDIEALPDVVANQLVQSLKQTRAGLEAQYQEKLSRFKPDYPEMQQLRRQIEGIDRQVSREMGNLRAAINSRYQASLTQETMLRSRIRGLQDDVLDLDNRSIQFNILRREAVTNQELYDGLLQRYKEIGVAGGIGANNISVVDRAEIPGAPFKPNLVKNMFMALVVGSLLALLTAMLLHYLDRRIRTPSALATLTGLPVFGIIPELPRGQTPAQASEDPRSPFSEAYRSVRTALQFATPQGLPRSLLITSPASEEGKTTSARELAHNVALLGKRVVLVDADLRNPSLHKLFARPNEVGFSSVLADAAPVDSVIQDSGHPGLSLITSGPLPPNPPELLGGEGLADMLAWLGARFDMVILDGPPVMGLADAPLLAHQAQATVVVVMAQSSRTDAVSAALQRLRSAQARVLGTLFTHWDTGLSGEYGYGQYSYGAAKSR